MRKSLIFTITILFGMTLAGIAKEIPMPIYNGMDAKVIGLTNGSMNDVSTAFAYPVPFIPSEGHTDITFSNISPECTITIYTISGELLRTITHNSGFYYASWNVTNDELKPLASGVYIYRIESLTHTKEGKLIVVR